MMMIIITAVITGMFSGIASHYITNNKILLPRKTRLAFHPGFLGEMFVGSLASVVGVAMLGAETMLDVIKVSILAGISGQTFLLHNLLFTEKEKASELKDISKMVNNLETRSKQKHTM